MDTIIACPISCIRRHVDGRRRQKMSGRRIVHSDAIEAIGLRRPEILKRLKAAADAAKLTNDNGSRLPSSFDQGIPENGKTGDMRTESVIDSVNTCLRFHQSTLRDAPSAVPGDEAPSGKDDMYSEDDESACPASWTSSPGCQPM